MISVYIHWPFCKSKCPYCDFNSHVRDGVDTIQFIKAYLIEIESYKEVLAGKVIKSIFFGGGTPSLAPPTFFEQVLSQLAKYATFDANIEITLEANPTSFEASKFHDYAKAGVNRVSIGVQSFNEDSLKFLGREHSADEAKKAISYASKYFDRYSFDLIYALPHQTLEEWRQELEYALQYTQDHLSLYQLTIEKGTQFYGDYQRKKFTMPSQELAADFYQCTQEIMDHNHLPYYEVSNHAPKGYESIHNMNYWKYGDYLGIGAGAHGRYHLAEHKYATINLHLPEKWLLSLEQKGHALQHKHILTDHQQQEERIMMGLRLKQGISKYFMQGYDAHRDYQYFLEEGYLEEYDTQIKATTKGILVLNYLISSLLSSPL